MEGYTRYCYTDELKEYEETELCRNDWTTDGADAPYKAETMRPFACDYQTYILNWGGSMYNEICEFTFDEGNLANGYYCQYQANRDSQK